MSTAKSSTSQYVGHFQSIVGQRFDRLVVLGRVLPNDKHNKTRWKCLCDCGNTPIVVRAQLTTGKTKSCGCLALEVCGYANRIHGLSTSSEYHIYNTMKARCTNPQDQNFHRYGGRGIVVCERWLASFEAFLEDMGPRPSPDLTLERMDNNGPYEKANCRWATWAEQFRNKRNNHFVSYKGEQLTIAEVVKASGRSRGAVSYRTKHGLPLE